MRFVARYIPVLLSLSVFFSPSNALGSRGLGHSKEFAKRVASSLANRTVASGDDPAELQRRDGTKYVFMHHIVGNTYPYTQADWADDFQRIAAKGVDAVALNIGSDPWQPGQIASAYAAAQAHGSIKCFISFDFTAFPCSVPSVVSLANQYGNHPAQFQVNGRPMISSYEGGCLGEGGWASIKSQTNAYLMPFISGLEGSFNNWPSLDSWYCWGCAWPQGDYDKNTNDDQYYISQLGSRYAATVSVWFYTHFNYKNFVLRADDWLLNSRWEQLISLRSQLTFVEMITWNDYGESDYYGPFKGAQPSGTTWAQNSPHTAWFDMSQYYITAFKTGSYPAITQDVIYYWARPHPASAFASGDPLPQPTSASWTQDYLWAAVFATSPASVTLTSGGNKQTFSVNAGVTKLKLPLAPGSISVAMVRSGATIINQTPSDFQFIPNPVLYNYNAYVGSATATSSQQSPAPPPASPPPTTTSKTATTPSPTSGSWSYVGCYYDSASSRVLSLGPLTSKSQTVSTCLASCLSKGYAYGGTEYGVECWCGASIAHGSPAPAGDCNQPCSGKSSDKCGAGDRLSLYHHTKSRVALAAPPPAPSGWGYAGCYIDDAERILRGSFSEQSGMTTEVCQGFCAAGGYSIAGTQYGTQCFCDNQLNKQSGAGVAATDGECDMPCAGDGTESCGGGYRMNMYVTSNAPSLSRRRAGLRIDAL